MADGPRAMAAQPGRRGREDAEEPVAAERGEPRGGPCRGPGAWVGLPAARRGRELAAWAGTARRGPLLLPLAF